jgi:sugar phosphate isomerase/epimerase
MYTTRTGNFSIGIRNGWSPWQKQISNVISWAKDAGFGTIDLGPNLEQLSAVVDAGLNVGSIDLPAYGPLLAADKGRRHEAVEKSIEFIARAAGLGARNFFFVALPEDGALPREESFAYTVESLAALAPALEQAQGRLVIEGYPGAGAQCCTPETYRAAFKEVPSAAIGINYDPSHLLRMGIDPIRFLKEFGGRVGHVHGKDCEVLADDLYEYGTEQKATFKKNPGFGATSWRYTIPGQGNTPWGEVMRVLAAHNYRGAVSIELEDANYNGSEDGEKAGFIAGAQFLSAC